MQSKQSREEDVAGRSTPLVISGADELFSGKHLRNRKRKKQASDQPLRTELWQRGTRGATSIHLLDKSINNNSLSDAAVKLINN